jgi:hypothetical protein
MNAMSRALKPLESISTFLAILVLSFLVFTSTVEAQSILVDPQVAIGSSTTLTIDAGSPNTPYWVDMGKSGTAPGVRTRTGRVIPLNRPWFYGNQRPAAPRFSFTGFEGLTDAFGMATATLYVPQDTRLVGVRFHAVFATVDPNSPDGLGVISSPATFEIVAANPAPPPAPPTPPTPPVLPASNPWNVVWPADVPSDYRPALPLTPEGSNIVSLAGGAQTLSVSDTEYRLSGNVGSISVSPGTQRIVIDGMGFTAVSITLPSVWPIPGPIRVNDIVIRDIVLNGGLNGSAIQGACRRLLLQNITTQTNTISNYCFYTRFSEDVVIEGSNFHTLGNEACVRLVDVKRFAGFRNTFDSELKHAFRIHFSSHYIWLSDTVCGKPLYIGYVEQLASRPPTDLRNVMLRRLHVYPQVGGNVFQIAYPAFLVDLDMSDCTFHADGPLTQNQVNGFMSTANNTPSWTYSSLLVL